MKSIGAVAIVACALLSPFAFGQQAGGPGLAGASAAPAWKFKVQKLSRQQVDSLLGKPDQLLIIDVRRPDELTTIGGFPAYLSIQAPDLKKYTAFIPKGRTIITVSNHAVRAGAAGDLLAGKGFKVAGAVGVEDYEGEGGALTRIAPPPPKAADAGKPGNQNRP